MVSFVSADSDFARVSGSYRGRDAIDKRSRCLTAASRGDGNIPAPLDVVRQIGGARGNAVVPLLVGIRSPARDPIIPGAVLPRTSRRNL